MRPSQLAVVVIAAVAAAAGYHYWKGRAPQAVAPGISAPAPAPPSEPAIPLPPLEQSDALVRSQANQLSPRLATMLTSDNLLRRLAAAVDIVANGDSPRESLAFLKPRGKFAVVAKQGRLYIDPRSYERYDTLADIVDSLDAATLASLYRQWKPLLEAAYGELGQGMFEPRLTAAMTHLLAAPVIDEDIRVRRKVITYRMADERLEALSASQKHLLRMGPKNARKIQNKVRELALALGVALPI
jgi:hypothetical protein